ncbi:hypothetical protein [Streptomyces phytophilus]|uniref:hypothetical protein n=1 Tax=Streptomyces phytophilus TaxID=722715 RepID=UPI0015EFDDD8|nr:hypothetical protein [Streptomyces phytophilus]
MSSDNSRHTVSAAQGRQDRDSAILGAEGDRQRQEMVSQHIHEKVVGEGAPMPGEPRAQQ